MDQASGARQAAGESSRPAPSEADIRAQVRRMLENASFRPSHRRRDMLRFIVDETLAGRGDRLKGATIAMAVFGRDETFDQQSDPVVRLEARRLRGDLDSYYVDAGADDPIRITIPKGAYVPHFAWRNEDVSAPAPPPEPEPPETRPADTDAGTPPAAEAGPGVERRRARFFPAAALLAVGGIVAIALAVFAPRGAGPDVAQARTPAIIVLPFEAFGDIDEIGLIAAGVTEELIANLMLFQNFRVYSTTSSFRQDAGADPTSLGRELGVSYVVTGIMQSQNGQAHLRARLVDTRTGEVRWSGGYDQPLTTGDLLGAQRDLAVAISTELGESYGAVNEVIGQRMILDSAPSMPSYTCILRAFDFRRDFDDALFAPALACLQQAVMRDPDYADAWGMLGWLQFDAASQDIAPEADHPAHIKAAFEAASRAIEIDPDNLRGLTALAAITFDAGDYARSERLLRRALALNPNNPETIAQLGWRLSVRGNWDEGIPLLNKAIARSASPPGWYFHLISVHEYLRGNYAAALAAAEPSAGSGSAIGLSLAAISHAKLGNSEAAADDLAAMAEAWPLLAATPPPHTEAFTPPIRSSRRWSRGCAMQAGRRRARGRHESGRPRLHPADAPRLKSAA